MIRVFLDANVYFAGIFSRAGASSLILELARKKQVAVLASRLVLREADRNLRRKTDPQTLKAFHLFLKETSVHILRTPPDKVLKKYEPYIHPKDVPILATAVEAGVDYLVTLDRRHFLTPKILSHFKEIKILTSGDFVREWSALKKR